MPDTPSESDKKPRFTVIESAGESARKAAETEEAVNTLLEQDGVNDEAILMKISELEQEHRDLDLVITTLEERLPYERLTLQRMKKRKLLLKDKIFELKDKLEPDIIA